MGGDGVIRKMPKWVFLRFPVFNYKDFSYAGAKKREEEEERERKELSEKERIPCTGTKCCHFSTWELMAKDKRYFFCEVSSSFILSPSTHFGMNCGYQDECS